MIALCSVSSVEVDEKKARATSTFKDKIYYSTVKPAKEYLTNYKKICWKVRGDICQKLHSGEQK
jgi:hypothetical protein